MHVVTSVLGGAILALALGVPVYGQSAVGTQGGARNSVRAVGNGGLDAAGAPAATGGAGFDAGRLEGIVKRLGDTSFAVREAAQKELEGVPVGMRETLVKLADGAVNAEVKASLVREIGLMDERMAIDPPPITLSVKDATAQEVAAALGKAVGTRFTLAPGMPGRYTLTAVDRPYWEIVQELGRQHALWPSVEDHLRAHTFPHVQIQKGIAITADEAKLAPGGTILVDVRC